MEDSDMPRFGLIHVEMFKRCKNFYPIYSRSGENILLMHVIHNIVGVLHRGDGCISMMRERYRYEIILETINLSLLFHLIGLCQGY